MSSDHGQTFVSVLLRGHPDHAQTFVSVLHRGHPNHAQTFVCLLHHDHAQNFMSLHIGGHDHVQVCSDLHVVTVKRLKETVKLFATTRYTIITLVSVCGF